MHITFQRWGNLYSDLLLFLQDRKLFLVGLSSEKHFWNFDFLRFFLLLVPSVIWVSEELLGSQSGRPFLDHSGLLGRFELHWVLLHWLKVRFGTESYLLGLLHRIKVLGTLEMKFSGNIRSLLLFIGKSQERKYRLFSGRVLYRAWILFGVGILLGIGKSLGISLLIRNLGKLRRFHVQILNQTGLFTRRIFFLADQSGKLHIALEFRRD